MAMNDYYDGLWKEVWERKLSDKEVASVVAELQEPKPDTNIYTLLAILCYCESQAIQYTPLIERYLNGPDDFVASEALWVLCSCWDLSPNYTNEMLAFMESAPQDEEYQDRKPIAIQCAGDHLKRYSAPKLLRKITEILEDGNENERARQTAYEALRVITGGDKWKHTMLPRNFDPNTDVDPDVVKLAKERLAREEQQG